MTAIASVLLAVAIASAPPPSTQTPAQAPPAAAGSAQQSRPPGRFGFLTAAELVDQCNAKSPYALTYCYAYLAGLHDAMRAYEVWLGHPDFCAPDRVTLEELRRIFLAFVEANPAYRDGQGASVGAVALKGAFPCPPASH